ncbi:MAG: hypothetical protein FVQ84_13085 [Planctomycetes bacterium]|nr:hypothetical protein [Planctomycetota bacterium]
MPGAYRIDVWNDPQPKANSDDIKNYRDDLVSLQAVTRCFRRKMFRLKIVSDLVYSQDMVIALTCLQ